VTGDRISVGPTSARTPRRSPIGPDSTCQIARARARCLLVHATRPRSGVCLRGATSASRRQTHSRAAYANGHPYRALLTRTTPLESIDVSSLFHRAISPRCTASRLHPYRFLIVSPMSPHRLLPLFLSARALEGTTTEKDDNGQPLRRLLMCGCLQCLPAVQDNAEDGYSPLGDSSHALLAQARSAYDNYIENHDAGDAWIIATPGATHDDGYDAGGGVRPDSAQGTSSTACKVRAPTDRERHRRRLRSPNRRKQVAAANLRR